MLVSSIQVDRKINTSTTLFVEVWFESWIRNLLEKLTKSNYLLTHRGNAITQCSVLRPTKINSLRNRALSLPNRVRRDSTGAALPVLCYLNKENQQNSSEMLGQDPTSTFSEGE